MNAGTGANTNYRPATAADQKAIRRLLRAARLPRREVEAFLEDFMVAEADGVVIACGAAERHEDTAVLRSIAVAEPYRGGGIGRGLCEALIDRAGRGGVRDFYLFTRDAAPFWEKLGFRDVGLEDWREPARSSLQYAYVAGNLDFAEKMDLHTMWRAA